MFLANIVANNYPIVYVDESSFSAWAERKTKAWNVRNEPVIVHINNKQYFRTMFAGIGDCLDEPVFMKGKSTNSDDFGSFIEEVAKHIKIGSKKPVLIMDNATAHTAKKNRNRLNDYFIPVYMPSHSSAFNSVERVWSVAKRNFAILSL